VKKTQRQDVIDQIRDLSKSRKSVYIKDLNIQGIHFEETIPDDQAEGQDSIVRWNRITYYQDNSTQPSESLFENIDNLINPNINTDDIVSLSGLSDTNITYQINSKYTTIIKTQKTITDTLTLSGKCWATLYINNTLVLTHKYDPEIEGSITTVTSIPIPFPRQQEITIQIYVYGHLNDTNTETISLSGRAFSFIEYNRLETVLPPLNLFATDNLINTVKVSWEQQQGTIGQGGGVEVWGKQQDIESDYVLLGRVPYPSEFFMHTEQIGSSGLISNATLQRYNFYGDTELGAAVPDSEYTDGTGLVDWGVTNPASGAGQFYVSNSSIPGQEYMLSYNVNLKYDIPFNEEVSSTLRVPAEIINLKLQDPILFTYNSTYTLKVDSAITQPTIPTSGHIEWVWDYDPNITDAQVQCIVYISGSPTTFTVDAVEGSYIHELTFSQIYNYYLDPSYIDAEFKTTNALRNSDSADSEIYYQGTSIHCTHSDLASGVLDSKPFTVKPDEELTVEILTSDDFGVFQLGGILYTQKENGDPSGNVHLTNLKKTRQGTLYKYTKTIKIINPEARVAFLSLGISAPNESGSGEIKFHQIDVLKLATKSLPSGAAYSYKIRNYTRTYSFSEFTDPVVGYAAREIYYLTLTADTEYVSSFQSTKIYARATSPLSYIDVETVPPDGEYVIPLQEVGHSLNLADYTFEYRPLLSNCVIFDTFETDRDLRENPDANGGLTNGFETYENSPARIPAVWRIEGPTTPYLWADSVYKFWNPGDSESNAYSTFIQFDDYNRYKYKEYDLTKVSTFYSGILGNSGYGGAHNQKDPKNMDKFSLGMILRIDAHSQNVGENSIITRSPQIYTLHVYPHSTNVVRLALAIRGNQYSWQNPDNGDVVLIHTMPVTTDADTYFYVHASADCNALDDPTRTYMAVHEVSLDTDATVENLYSDNVLINSTRSEWWNWEDADQAFLGFSSGSATGDFCTFTVDTFYLTANIIEKSIIDTIISPLIYETRNPFYPTYGYSTGEAFRVTAEALPITAAMEDQNEGAIPVDTDTLRGEITLTSDWTEPDGTCYILREAYTMSQLDIDTISDEQPGHTYTIVNKIYADMTSLYAPVTNIRFSNDKINWSTWRGYAGNILYPWDLIPIFGVPTDTEEGGDRYVWAQTVTTVGVSSDYVLKVNHKDHIFYNPLGSVGGIESWNYVPGVEGWSLSLSGDAEFNNIFIRGRSVFAGKVIDSKKMRDHNIGTQLGPEGFTTDTDQGPNTIFKNITHLTSPDGINYNSDIAIDLTSNLLFIPTSHEGKHQCQFYKFSTHFLTGYREVGPTHPNLDPYAQTHIALSKEFVFIAGGLKIRKYHKEHITNNFIDHIAEYDLNKTCQGIHAAYSANGEFRLYVLKADRIGISARTVLWNVLDEDLQVLSYASTTFQSNLSYPTFMSKSWDCNGKYLVFTDYENKIFSYPLGFDGLFPDTNLDSFRNTTITGVVDLGSVFNVHKWLMSNNLSPIYDFATYHLTYHINKISGIRIFKDSYLFYTTYGTYKYNQFTGPNYFLEFMYNAIGTAECVRAEEGTGVTSILYMCNFPSPEYGQTQTVGPHTPPIFTVARPQLNATQAQLYSTGINMQFNTYNNFAPYVDNYNSLNGGGVIDGAFGFTSPMIVGDKLHIAHCSSTMDEPSSSVYVFDFDGRSLSFNNPSVITSYSDFQMCSMVYDGKSHYKLMAKHYNLGGGNWLNNQLYVVKH